jgi:hypothetical protein
MNIKSAFLPLAVSLSMFSVPANSALYTFTGAVATLDIADSTLGANLDYLSISGLSSAGACMTGGSAGLVVIRMRDDDRGKQQFALTLAAKMSGTTLTVVLDDVGLRDSNGYCFVRELY